MNQKYKYLNLCQETKHFPKQILENLTDFLEIFHSVGGLVLLLL